MSHFSGGRFSTVVAVVMSAVLVGCQRHGSRQQPAVVERLAPAVAVMERYRVTAYRNQSWCENVVYQRGAFSNNTEQST